MAESATDVRREFTREMLSATKPPKNAATWTAMMVALAPHQLSEFHSSDLLPELIGDMTWTTYDAKKKIAAAATAASESRAWMLTENGHTLSNVEKVISGELRPEDIDIA